MNDTHKNPHKLFVQVIAKYDTAGNITPLSIIWEDGKVFEIDKVLDSRKAASLKAGGIGIRYTVRIRSKDVYLYYEDPQWYLEA